jgi:hypothetical protein
VFTGEASREGIVRSVADRARVDDRHRHRLRMINYTKALTVLMQDIVARVPMLSFINIPDVLVFARKGRSQAEGAFATCHSLGLPASEPGYYFWRDRRSGRVTRRSEWFVTKSPVVTIGKRRMKYLMSFALPRFCDQSLDRSRKGRFYPGAEPWMAKLDTVVHELYHIDPDQTGIRRIERGDGTYSANCHSARFFAEVADMVQIYLDTRPDPRVYDFLRHDFTTLESRHGGVAGLTFSTFPSFPQRYIERLAQQPPCESDVPGVKVEPLRLSPQPTRYTQADLLLRRFSRGHSRRTGLRAGPHRAWPAPQPLYD